ncbi:MAG TPA: CGNR zinc finger domain-containing protein [Solirubrobacterales bacterium]|nr:CGNR zinc finger domain-containing protein [Solirubrobacterales bacterium]
MSSDLNNEIEFLVEFVNTRDLEEETDAVAEPALLRSWIAENTGELVSEPDGTELQRVLDLRESLRALLRGNNGHEPGAADLTALRAAVERSRYRPTLSPQGLVTLDPARADLSGFEARLLLALERLQTQGAWPRLKACTDDGCQWAFYDSTRNHSRTWCSMDVCGNREKTRRYRRRKDSG